MSFCTHCTRDPWYLIAACLGGRDGTFLLRLQKEGPEGKTLYPALGDPARPAPGPETVRRRVRWLLSVLSAEIHLLG